MKRFLSMLLVAVFALSLLSAHAESVADEETPEGYITVTVPESTYHLFNATFERGLLTDEEYEWHSKHSSYGGSVNGDMYPMPAIFSDQGNPKGQYTTHTLAECKAYPGTSHDYMVYVPSQYDPATPANLILVLDANFLARGDYPSICTLCDNLIAAGEMPVSVVLFSGFGTPGPGQPLRGYAEGEVNRSVEYDTPSDLNARYITEELMPLALEGLNISANPEDRAIFGISSSGAAAFAIAWFKPEQFGKLYLASASFTNIRGGMIWPYVIRVVDPKPIKVFAVAGKHDNDTTFGNWLYANLAFGSSLHYKKYDYRFYLSEAGHSFAVYLSMMPDAIRWLFNDVESQAENMELVDFSLQIPVE